MHVIAGGKEHRLQSCLPRVLPRDSFERTTEPFRPRPACCGPPAAVLP